MPFKYNALLGLGLDNTIPLDGAGKIPSTFLPSYVDDVEEYNNLAAFPATGETGKIYVAIDTGFAYRWSGSVYVQIGITAAAGATTQVQFNDAGAFGGDSGLTFNKTTDALSAGGFIPTSSTVPANGIYLPAANSVAVATNGTGRLFISSTGLVGIGTTSPAAKLHIVTSGAGDIRHADGTRAVSMGSTGTVSYIGCITAGQDFALYAGNGEKARIDSSGRLLVGTSSTSGVAKLQVQGYVGSDTSFGVFALRTGSTPAVNQTVGRVDFNDSDDLTGARITAARDATGTWSASSKPSRLVFSTTADGASSPTERMRITSNAYVRLAAGTGGIQFGGDTAAANALDDYEEGTFTPAVEGTTTVGAGTYSVQLGRYVKIGKTITVWIRLTWSAHTGTGDGAIAGLPFTSQTIGGGHHLSAAPIGYETNYDTAANTVLSAFVEPNGTRIRLAQLGVGTQSGGAAAALDAAAAVTVSATYEAAA
jgi:hypothetical protein